MKLTFTDKDLGFVLSSVLFEKSSPAEFDIDLAWEIGEDVYVSRDTGEIVFYSLFFYQGDMNFDVWIQNTKNLYKQRTFYDVPALGVSHATFPEVLEAVRQYYLKKATRKEAVPA